jgi:hypothetical protein
MRETIAFFLKDEALRAVAFLVGGGVRARLLCHHLSLQCSTPTYLREKRIKKKLSAWFSDLPAINATSFRLCCGSLEIPFWNGDVELH